MEHARGLGSPALMLKRAARGRGEARSVLLAGWDLVGIGLDGRSRTVCPTDIWLRSSANPMLLATGQRIFRSCRSLKNDQVMAKM